MAKSNSTPQVAQRNQSLRLVSVALPPDLAPTWKSEVYSRLAEDGTLEFGFRGCDSDDAQHHLIALSKLIGSLAEIVDGRGDDLIERHGRLVLFDGPQ
jgi:hypothetical protein